MIARHLMALGAPLLPDPDQARDWAEQELSKSEYTASQPNWFQKAFEWVIRQIMEVLQNLLHNAGPASRPITALVVTALVVAVALLIYRFGRPSRNARNRSATDIFDATAALTPAEHRERAQAAYASGDYDSAVLEWLRAITRELEERTVLAPRAGRTAHEMALEAAPALGANAATLHQAADTFDAVRYADRRAAKADAELLRAADDVVRKAQLVLTAPSAPVAMP